MYLVSAGFALLGCLLIALQFLFPKLQTYARRSKLKRKHNCQPPKEYGEGGPFGFTWFLASRKRVKARNFLKGMRDLHDEYGNTFQTYSLGRKVIYTIDPENVKSVLSLDIGNYAAGPGRYALVGPLIGHSIFTSDGAFWKHARAEVKPIFAHPQTADLVYFEKHLEGLLKRIPGDGSTFDIAPLLADMFFNFSMDSLFGQSLLFPQDDHTAENQAFRKTLHAAIAGASRRQLPSKVRIRTPDAAFDNACQEAHAITEKYLDAALKHLDAVARGSAKIKGDDTTSYLAGTNRPIFLFDLIKRSSGDRLHLRNQLLTVLLGGHDSTAILVSNALFLLSRDPAAWAKLRSEASQLPDQEPLRFNKLKSMSYLRYVLNETLRLHPVALMKSRLTQHDTILPVGGGRSGRSPVFVAQGTRVVVRDRALHWSRSTFGADAHLFRPERWASTRPGWGYIPFGGGPRLCPAQQWALAEASATLVRLARRFKVLESRDQRDFVEHLRLKVENANGVVIGLRGED